MAGISDAGFASLGVFTSSKPSWVKNPNKNQAHSYNFPKIKRKAICSCSKWLEMCSVAFQHTDLNRWVSYNEKIDNISMMITTNKPVSTEKFGLEVVQPCTDSVSSTTAPCNFLLARRYWLPCCVILSSMFSSMVLMTLNWSAICVSKLCRRSSICPKCAHFLLIHSLKTRSMETQSIS